MTTKFIYKEVYRTFVGDKIGKGCYREVYESILDPTCVVKIEKDSGDFSNIREWENWRELQDNPLASKWLAPCIHISPCGSVLIQKRVTKVEELPDKLPKFLADIKPSNFGMLDGNLVCCDYAILNQDWNFKLGKVPKYD